MKNLIPISQEDYDNIWDRFYEDFSFNPSIKPSDWPSIKTDKPNFKFSIADLWGYTYSEAKRISFLKKAIDAFISITNPGDEIIVLDWNHECFYSDPRKMTTSMMIPDDNSSIMIPSFIPDGDYYIFITKDFKNIWFGHPWEKTITIIGERLINAYKMDEIKA